MRLGLLHSCGGWRETARSPRLCPDSWWGDLLTEPGDEPGNFSCQRGLPAPQPSFPARDPSPRKASTPRTQGTRFLHGWNVRGGGEGACNS